MLELAIRLSVVSVSAIKADVFFIKLFGFGSA